MSVRGPVLLSPPRAMKSPARYGLSSRRNDDWGMGLAGAGATSTASVTPFAGSPATTPGGDTGAELVRPGGEWVLRLSGWDSSNTRKTNRKQSTGVPRSNTPISGRMSVQDEWRIRRLLTYYIDKGQDDMARDAVRKLAKMGVAIDRERMGVAIEKMGAAIDRETLDRLDELQGWGAPEPPSPPRHLMTPVMLSEVAAEYRESLIDLL
ncbi:hypothetical protein T484DRAFT_1920867 [Baffinella frigidus]|nr:hypothetical protein T484DRAFT_1920867 [Cryptophyta sp. CCMP2293]